MLIGNLRNLRDGSSEDSDIEIKENKMKLAALKGSHAQKSKLQN